MQTKITIRNEAQTCYIDIEGTIGVPEQNQFDNADSRVATYETFRREVARIADVAAASVVVNIRSTGGDVNDALLIYEALLGLGARITTRCYGYTASAATIIAQAADAGCREISANALYLIHNSVCAIEGNAATLEGRSELLRKTDERLARLYADRSGRDYHTFVELMAENDGAGRWLSAEETVQAGLADRITDSLVTGSLIPEPDGTEDASQGDGSKGESAAEGALQGGGETIPTARAAAPDPRADDDVADAASVVARGVARCLLRRFSYRWEQLMERMRQKRELRRARKDAEKQSGRDSAAESAAGKPSKSERRAARKGGADVTDMAGVSGKAPSTSAIAFDEGQRRYTRTTVDAVDDPSMGAPVSAANEKAYADDARAFASRG